MASPQYVVSFICCYGEGVLSRLVNLFRELLLNQSALNSIMQSSFFLVFFKFNLFLCGVVGILYVVSCSVLGID